ncbi:armadillo repeat-containing protein 12-like [Acipenser oxyrinchus oxyrinchus]|uniref:Armadillo repeat-containing protein 12-like n=1 Tax=Acipenser oxyrinchus oxyrinchus TaxID=40147 RepID=A0AAD8CIM3_ACIOX|nr:armadillo repeat-containing protein 12-like [Acipenser oxyrinchus oxyrinchus]KAK1152846.1 armadillo repeat-containing protein 12-like [Acipenser oxyrinchus oxyrinchus]
MAETFGHNLRKNAVGVLVGAGAAYLLYNAFKSGGGQLKECAGKVKKLKKTQNPEQLNRLFEQLEEKNSTCDRAALLCEIRQYLELCEHTEVTFMPAQIGIIAAMLEDEDVVVTTNCFQVLNSLAGNFSNQKEMQKCIPRIIYFTAQSACLEQQIAGLGLISTLALCSGNHPEILKGIPEYLRILQTARYSGRVSMIITRILFSLSTNRGLAYVLLNSKVEPAFLHLFNPFVNKDIIYQLLAFVSNLNESLKSENSSCVQWEYNEESLYVLLFSSDSPLLNKLLPLMNHNDTRVKSTAVSIVSKLV